MSSRFILRPCKKTLELPKDYPKQSSAERGALEKIFGRIVALDLGQKRVGVAISDELGITVRSLASIQRTNWKQLVRDVSALALCYDAQALVIGLPLRLDGTEGGAAAQARKAARNFQKSLVLPVYLQDERLTSKEAEEILRTQGNVGKNLHNKVDSESAALILRDFLDRS